MSPTFLQRCGRLLFACWAILLAGSFLCMVAKFRFGHHQLGGLTGLLNVDGEQNLPTFFTVVLLLACGGLLAKAAAGCRLRQERRCWALLAAGFVLMAFDEFACLHERFITVVHRWWGDGLPPWLHFGWVLPGMVLVLAVGVCLAQFWMELERPTRRRFLVAAVVYLGGALGAEMVGGAYSAAMGARPGENANDLLYNAITHWEEGAEMAGIILFLLALLHHEQVWHGETPPAKPLRAGQQNLEVMERGG